MTARFYSLDVTMNAVRDISLSAPESTVSNMQNTTTHETAFTMGTANEVNPLSANSESTASIPNGTPLSTTSASHPELLVQNVAVVPDTLSDPALTKAEVPVVSATAKCVTSIPPPATGTAMGNAIPRSYKVITPIPIDLELLSKLCDSIILWQSLNTVRAISVNRKINWKEVSEIMHKSYNITIPPRDCHRQWKFLAYGRLFPDDEDLGDSDPDEGYFQPIEAFDRSRTREDIEANFNQTGTVNYLKRKGTPKERKFADTKMFVPNRIGTDSNSIKSITYKIAEPVRPKRPSAVQFPIEKNADKLVSTATVGNPSLIKKPTSTSAQASLKKANSGLTTKLLVPRPAVVCMASVPPAATSSVNRCVTHY